MLICLHYVFALMFSANPVTQLIAWQFMYSMLPALTHQSLSDFIYLLNLFLHRS